MFTGLELYALEKAGFVLKRAVLNPDEVSAACSVLDIRALPELPSALSSLLASEHIVGCAKDLLGPKAFLRGAERMSPRTSWGRPGVELTSPVSALMQVQHALHLIVPVETGRIALAPGLHLQPISEPPPDDHTVSHTLQCEDIAYVSGPLPFRLDGGAWLCFQFGINQAHGPSTSL